VLARVPRVPSGLQKTERALIGVSGGRDSVALLHLLVTSGFKKLVVCHVDHGLRGRASAADARFVQRLAKRLRVDFVSEKIDVAQLAKENRQSLETAARNARHAFFARVASAKKCRTLFLAHHADDQAETFLFNLFRGAGAAGLGAMRHDTTRVFFHDEKETVLRIVRPLLGVWRSEIDEYVRAHKLAFREDETNRSLENARSVMRHRILPFIEKNFGRDVKPALWRAAEIFAAQNEWLQKSLGSLGVENAENLTASAELSVAKLRELPDALQRFVLHQWLTQTHAVRDVSFDLIESIRELLAPDSRKAKINLPGARHVRRRAKKLFVE